MCVSCEELVAPLKLKVVQTARVRERENEIVIMNQACYEPLFFPLLLPYDVPYACARIFYQSNTSTHTRSRNERRRKKKSVYVCVGYWSWQWLSFRIPFSSSFSSSSHLFTQLPYDCVYPHPFSLYSFSLFLIQMIMIMMMPDDDDDAESEPFSFAAVTSANETGKKTLASLPRSRVRDHSSPLSSSFH